MVSDTAATTLPTLPSSPAPSSRRSGRSDMSSSSSRSSATSYDMSSLPTPRSSGAYYDAHNALDDDSCDPCMASDNGEFYNEVESFLSRPSPSLGKLSKASKSAENLLPALKAERSKLRGADAHRPEMPVASSGYGRSASEKGKKKAPLDLSLVQQAFAYANELRAQELQENDTPDDMSDAIAQHLAKHAKQPERPSRAQKPPPPQKTSSKPTKPKQPSKKTSAIYGVPEKQPPKTKAGPDWDSCSKEVSTGAQSNSNMDSQLMQQLLSNFQNGTTLSELRQELAASQASMKESRQVLQGAAKSFFMKGGAMLAHS